jgi:hypothetical protein
MDIGLITSLPGYANYRFFRVMMSTYPFFFFEKQDLTGKAESAVPITSFIINL